MEKTNINTLYKEVQKKLGAIRREYKEVRIISTIFLTIPMFLIALFGLIPIAGAIIILTKGFSFHPIGFTDILASGFCLFVAAGFLKIPLGYFISRHWHLKKYKYAEYASTLNENLTETINKISTLDDILQKTEHILKLTSNILGIKKLKFPNILKKLGYSHLIGKLVLDGNYREALIGETDFLWEILTDLRSDLQIRLTEQQSLLESAKSEVTEIIQGTSELAQVSELQKIRLDKQIEQFEELQRVLVRG